MRTRMLLIVLFAALFATVSLQAQNAAVTVNVDATANRHRINPNIYGIAFASTAQLLDLNVPLNRSGGNAETRYNWQNNSSNRAGDYFFESIGYSSSTAGEHDDTFISDSKAGGAQPMVTVPIIGWVAKLGTNRATLASFSVAKYGAQQSTDPFDADAGNGNHTNGQPITGNDPTDANLAVTGSFQEPWFQHLIATWGNSSTGGLRYYLLDNEASIWHGAHRDVHPVGATEEETRDKMLDMAQRIKKYDAGALVLGPEEWGWSGYFYSGYDQQYGSTHGYCCYPDRAAHANVDYAPWLLQQFQLYEMQHQQRLLDMFTLHFYPQGGEFGDDVSTSMQQLRNRSTRALWDPAYTNESWINDKVQLIPRMRQWVDTNYPGTPIGLTEYNWGAEGSMNGATTQADILGILGRENADLATRWTTPDTGTPVYTAIKLYRNYDGSKSTFGDLSVSASGPNPDNVSTFAAVRSSDKALTITLINKALTGTTPATVTLSHYAPGATAQRWQLSSASGSIQHLADVVVASSTLSLTLPPQSITLLVISGNTDVNAPAIALNSTTNATAPGPYTFTGTASDDVGVTQVTWKMTGSTAASGTCTGTTNWNVTAPVNLGYTRVTFTAYDAAGNPATTGTTIINAQPASLPGNPPSANPRRRIAH